MKLNLAQQGNITYICGMENTEKKKGCVYFFRHIGLTPVKIGYSSNESPINRFEQFKTYAPYGSELLGFIITSSAKELETILHDRFSSMRLKGEWFDIKIEDVESVVNFYSNIEDIKEKNEFQIAWAKRKLNTEKLYDEFDSNIFSDRYRVFSDLEFNVKKVINQKELMLELGLTKNQMIQLIKIYDLKIGPHWTGTKTKKGYKLYCKQ